MINILSAATAHYRKLLHPSCSSCLMVNVVKQLINKKMENKYSDVEKERILKVINDPNDDLISRYDITKRRVKQIKQHVKSKEIQNISEIEIMEGFSEKFAVKLFDSILNGYVKREQNVSSKIKGQILHPHLYEAVRQSCNSVLAVYVSVNSVSWALINKNGYEVTDWAYHEIDYPGSKKLQITDILDIAWCVTRSLPNADICVMQAEPTTLRAGGSDPNNPKVIAVNLQKSQLISMIVTLINARSQAKTDSDDNENTDKEEDKLTHKVYFLRPTLPYRLYGTLVGNERVATNQTVEMLLQNVDKKSSNHTHVYISEQLKSMYLSRKDLEKDMLGHCLLLGLTFMDLCIYKNQDSVDKLTKRKQ